MSDNSDQCFELYINDGVIVNSHTSSKNGTDFLNNLGTLSIVEYKSDLGKCIEWHQCDVSIESDDQEWAIVKDSKCENKICSENPKSSRMPIIQIPFKNLLSFNLSRNNKQLTLVEHEGSISTTFFFQNGRANEAVDFLKQFLNTSVSKKDLNFYIVRDQKEVLALEKSFADLDLFSDDSSDAVWSFIKKFHDKPYETTMCAFSKVADAFQFRPQELGAVAELLNKSLTIDDLPDLQSKLSTEDYELIMKETPLPPRTLPFRSSPLTLEQLEVFFDENGRILQPDIIKNLIFHGGISPIMPLRAELWKFLLNYYPWDSTYADRENIKKQKKEEYYTMKLQWKTMKPTQEENFTAYKERKCLIEKDVCRTDRNMPYFAGDHNSNLEALQSILMTYVMYNFDLGYVQGMSDLLSPLLAQLNDEVDAFWCFTGFMDKVVSFNFNEISPYQYSNLSLYANGREDLNKKSLSENGLGLLIENVCPSISSIRRLDDKISWVDRKKCFLSMIEQNWDNSNFDLDQAGMKQQLQQLYCLLKYIEPELATYLDQQDANNMSFCFRWLLIWFKREFSFDEIFVLWEVLWTGLPCKNFHLLICAAILDTEKETIMSKNYGFTEILKHVNELANRIDLEMILRKAEGIYIQLSTASKIPAPIREIIGLKPLPDAENAENDKSENSMNDMNESKEFNESSKSQNGVLSQNSPYIDFDSLSFDNSISLQYL